MNQFKAFSHADLNSRIRPDDKYTRVGNSQLLIQIKGSPAHKYYHLFGLCGKPQDLGPQLHNARYNLNVG